MWEWADKYGAAKKPNTIRTGNMQRLAKEFPDDFINKRCMDMVRMGGVHREMDMSGRPAGGTGLIANSC